MQQQQRTAFPPPMSGWYKLLTTYYSVKAMFFTKGYKAIFYQRLHYFLIKTNSDYT